MDVQVNGKPMQLSDGLTAAGLLEQLGIEPERVVVEVNLNIVKRAQLDSTVLQTGDQVEIVHFVGGGSLDQRLETRGNALPQVSGLKSQVSSLRSRVLSNG